MRKLDEILNYNNNFVRNEKYLKYETTKNPNKKILVISCMDTRLTELLPKTGKLDLVINGYNND